MANRTVYGNTLSENGWPMVDEGSCTWVGIPGCNVNIEIQNGQPLQVLRAWVADINEYVQPVRDADTACWTAGNSVATSNHLSGTAVDIDWDDHPMGPEYAGWSPDQINKIRELLSFYEDTVFWGEDWDTPKDSMHFQMGYNTYGSSHTDDFISRKIRSDGFSTFRRAATAPPTAPPPPPPPPVPTPTPEPSPPPVEGAAAILARATGLAEDKAAEILPTLSEGLRLAQCNTVNRIAMFIAQTQEESDNYNTTEEYAKNGSYAPFIGRTWIQITWQSNYYDFGRWCVQQGLISDPVQFVNDPASLADIRWAGIGPAWYWTVQRPQINSLCDIGDIKGVTYAINGGYNGLDVRTANWNRALAVGDALLELPAPGLPAPGGDDFMSALTDDEQRELLDLARQVAGYRRESRSPLRWPAQGPIDTIAGFSWSTDANAHILLMEKLAVEYGDSTSIALLYAVATTSEPGREGDKALATKLLGKCSPADLALANSKIVVWLDAEKTAKAAA